TVTVTTTLKGSSVEEMETAVTKPIEDTISTIDGIDELRAVIKDGISVITVQFILEKSADVAAQEVRDKVSTILSQLPTGTDPPVIQKFQVDAMPVMKIAVSGKRNLRELSEIARKQIKEDIESLRGVGQVIMVGRQERAVTIDVDPDRLTAYNLSIAQVKRAVQAENVEVPGGRVDQGRRELVLRTMGRMPSAAAFNDLIVGNFQGRPILIRDIGSAENGVFDQGRRELVLRTMGRMPSAAAFNDLIVGNFQGRPILIRDIGSAENGVVEQRSLARLDGENAVQLIVRKQSGTNTVEVVDRVKARLQQLRGVLPQDIRSEVIVDQSRFIKASYDEVKMHLILGALLVAFTVFLFMHDWRSTIIASVAI